MRHVFASGRRRRIAAALAVCGGVALAYAAMGTAAPAGKPFAGQTLVIINWKGYGSDLPWVVKQFEQMTGAKVVNQFKPSDQGEIQMLQNGGLGKVDVAVTNHAYVQPSIKAGLLQPIDVSKVKTYSQLFPILRNLASIHSGGKVYGIPWEWGLTTLAYNPQATGGPVTSWKDLWSSKFAGKVAFFDDPQTAIETAAFYLGENPAKPNLDAVHKALSDLKKNVKVFWGSSNDWTRAFSTGQAVIGNAWSSLPSQLPKPQIKLVVPSAGSVGWLDSWTLVKNAPHPQLAYAWFNYITSAAFQTRWSKDPSHSAAGPANSVALHKLPAATLTMLGANPAWLPHLDFVQITAAQLKAWTTLWETIKAGG